jgi:hypothetical protein
VLQDIVLGAAVLLLVHAAAALVAHHFPVLPGADVVPALQVFQEYPWPMTLVVFHMYGLHHVSWPFMRTLAQWAVSDTAYLVLIPSCVHMWLWPLVWFPQRLAWLRAYGSRWGLLLYVAYGVNQRVLQCVEAVMVMQSARASVSREQAMWDDVGGILDYSEPHEAQ